MEHTHTHTAGAAMRGRTQAFSGGEKWRFHSTCATSISADIELDGTARCCKDLDREQEQE